MDTQPAFEPRTVNGYSLVEVLGKGTQATAYRAEKDNQWYCVRQHRTGGIQQLKLFVREFETLKELNHPQIPKVHELFPLDHSLYMVQDLVPGKCLATVLKEKGLFPEEKVIDIMSQLALILQYIHTREQPQVHRDIKPSNVMLDETGKAYLIDFGVVGNEIQRTQGGSTTFGTLGYSAPEVFAGQAKPASDLYSIGATALTLLSGKPVDEMMQGFTVAYQDKVRFQNPSLETLVDSLVQFDPAQRVESAAQLSEYLQQIKKGKSLHRRNGQAIGWLSSWLARLLPSSIIHAAAHTRDQELQDARRASLRIEGGEPVAKPKQVLEGITDHSYILLKNIRCTDADGNKFEEYPELYVAKDIFRDGKNQKNFTPYAAVVHCEQQGLFLPSFALSCNILARLYQQKDNLNCKRVLDQYKDKGNGTGYHAQNTLINFKTQKIIHSPTAADFSQNTAINTAYPRTEVSFAKETLQNSLLEDALRNSDLVRYVKQLTGLQDPFVLVEIGTYFDRPAKIWFSWDGQNGAGFTETRAGWLGCSGTYFLLSADYFLDYGNAARGVRRGSPRSGAP